ncbi:MAG: HAD-IIIA family hydrolase [Bacteroidia bacterium]|nr:HAD-IIIA family hydrolase [Bacteroidia bacterium]NNC85738.1 HAD-IIIA family hydrolase [Bacteroidia bacterium]NNM16696.1 HAD-IIIA family hydrolase [Bacteroidia bacterium]
MSDNFKERLKKVSTFVLDVDGVLTNGQLIILPEGELLRSMNIKDGFAMKHALNNGYNIIIISGGKSEGVPKRLSKLGVKHIYMECKDKLSQLKEISSELEIATDKMLFMGDDLPDIELSNYCGVATCPADACTEIKEKSIYMSTKKGGEGCVRDVIEQTLKVQDKWNFN